VQHIVLQNKKSLLINAYKNEERVALERAWRSEKPDEFEKWFSFLELFNSVINKLPTVKGCIWRGISYYISKGLKENQELTWWSVTSCSTWVNITKDFRNFKTRSIFNYFTIKHSTLCMIEVQNSKHLAGYPRHSRENEVILRLGTTLYILSDTLNHSDDLHILYFRELSAVIITINSTSENHFLRFIHFSIIFVSHISSRNTYI